MSGVFIVCIKGLFSSSSGWWQHGVWRCSKAVLSDDVNAWCRHSSHSATPESHPVAVLCNVCILVFSI